MAMDEISSGATTQTTSVENGAMLLFNVTEGIQHVANSSSSISTASAHTREKAEDGGKLVGKTVNQMQSIAESVSQSDEVIQLLNNKSKQIGDILEVIQNIADQTNLLALNAAIEVQEQESTEEDLQLLQMKYVNWRRSLAYLLVKLVN